MSPYRGPVRSGTRNAFPGAGLIWFDVPTGGTMATKPPPVPPASRSDKGPGSAEAAPTDLTKAAPAQPDKTGQQANTKVNTTHQGHQQDR